ncbi:anhydro-N-acetylmuramic acid kinase [Neptunomonas marina]|uniref:Anhydro-N-acetylmuramic acid kinase n=1 Tax=Neptunomonas marina TaxID=1815562 RepID=A0A437Q4C1_9GAMM|nr:anhydro-N-acetylmuramic acid kinase [Neptunomonas marina]RVU29273.1 anhydro-N-acetylmuramic acid kinase [Neptunomonas marina]
MAAIQRYIGVMSGTSLDGIDVAVAEIDEDHFRLVAGETYPIPAQLRKQILALTQPSDNEIDRLGELDTALGELFAECVSTFIRTHQLKASDIHAIGSHGQTIRHRPERGFTLQIGDPNIIAARTNITTVADFRRRDLCFGGQGAPLVPAFHQALFTSNERSRIILNIGGMANITLLPPHIDSNLTGYDTGPGNVLLDAWITHSRQFSFDSSGQWAASGSVDQDLLTLLLSTEYFQQPPPKSTGRELFHLDWLLERLETYGQPVAPADVQATLAELTAITIAHEVARHNLDEVELYVCGGGAHNTHLMSRLEAHIQPRLIADTHALGLSPDWVEAAAFAWLAYRNLQQLSGNCPAVTGASQATLLGGVYPAFR